MRKRRLSIFFSFLALFCSQLDGATLTVNVPGDSNTISGGKFSTGTLSGDLRVALQYINFNPGAHDVVFNLPASQSSISLLGILPPVNIYSANTLTFDGANSGNQITLTGIKGLISIRQGTVSISNMTLNGAATGGTGGLGGGGGGMGAGGGLFIDNAVVTLSNVTFSNCSAKGGTGGAGVSAASERGGGGGGGMNGGNGGGGGVGGKAGGGGGGWGGPGGTASDGPTGPSLGSGHAGGGIELSASGGFGGTAGATAGSSSGNGDVVVTALGGGGGGGNETGTAGAAGGGNGGTGNAAGGGGGGGSTGSMGSSATDINGAAGNNAAIAGNGGNGGVGGGGGGAGSSRSAASGSGATGGFGGYGGGGGGGSFGGGGNFGGGGGGLGSAFAYINNTAGAGGFGGGGGGRQEAAGAGQIWGLGGVGGGAGNVVASSSGGGGGGAGFGGAIFINAGTLTLQGNTTMAGSTVIGGTRGASDAGAGAAAGSDLFAVTGATLNFNPAANETITLAGSIADDSSTSVPGVSGSPTQGGTTPGSGSGAALAKNGAGTLVLSGASTYVGATTVNAGILTVNGSVQSAVTVNSTGTLKGMGTVSNNVTVASGGTIAPGGSIGTMTIIGDLNLNSGSTADIEASSSAASRINVTGTANLDGTLNVTASGTFPATFNATYTILTAGTVAGTFSSLILPSVLEGQILYSSTSVQLQLAYLSSLLTIDTAKLGGNPNATKIVEYLNRFTGASSLQFVFAALLDLTPDQLLSAIESLSPGRNAVSSYTSQNVAFIAAGAMSSRMSSARFMKGVERDEPAFASLFMEPARLESLIAEAELPKVLPPLEIEFEGEIAGRDRSVDTLLPRRAKAAKEVSSEPPEERAYETPYGTAERTAKGESSCAFWAQGMGSFSDQGSQTAELIPGFYSKTGGGLIGLDFYGACGQVGLGTGYARSSVHQEHHGGHADIDSFIGMLYGTVYGSHWFLELGAAGVMNWFENDRNISFPGFNAVAKSLYKGWQAVPHFAIGRDFDFDWGALEPFAAVDCAILYHEGYDETGAGALNMSVRGAYSYFLRSEAGLNAYQVLHRDWGYITLRETASYVNRQGFEVGKTKASLVGFPSGFTVTSFTDNQSLFSPAFEIFFKGNSGFFLSGTYHGEFGSDYRTDEVLGKIGLFF